LGVRGGTAAVDRSARARHPASTDHVGREDDDAAGIAIDDVHSAARDVDLSGADHRPVALTHNARDDRVRGAAADYFAGPASRHDCGYRRGGGGDGHGRLQRVAAAALGRLKRSD
jgi:hypothetical protein